MRLGVYADLVYRQEGETISTDRAFILFVAGLAERVGEVVLIGRLDPVPGHSVYVLPREGISLVPLPHYRSVKDVVGVVRALRGSRKVFAAELDRLDAVWLFGPYPVSLLYAWMCLRRGKPFFLGVRQDFPEYVRNRLPSRRWLWAVVVAHAFELAYRRLARRVPAVVVGEALGRKYPGSLATGFSLIRAGDVVPVDEALAKSWDGELRLLTVGRIDVEKNPLLLPEVLAGLPGWRLTVVGTGPLAGALERRAAELGVADRIELAGYVPSGPDLWALYRGSHAFLHISFTEGLPQVLFEAQAAGLPVVATDVGGVRAALEDGRTGLLVAPGRADLARNALERLRADPALREQLVRSGLEHAARETMDAQLARIAELFRSAVQAS